MPAFVPRYDKLLPNKNADDLKKIAVSFGGRSTMRKDECIEHVRSTLRDPVRLGSAVKCMGRMERAALGLMKMLGGEADLNALALAVRVTNTVAGDSALRQMYGRDTVEAMCINRGVVMAKTDNYYSDYSYSSSMCVVFTDERVLDHITSIERDPLPISAVDRPANSSYRTGQRVFLDMLSLLRSVDEIQGVGLTQSGDLRVNDIRKLSKKMGWGEEHAFDAMPFHRPAAAFVRALQKGRVLKEIHGELDADRKLDEIAMMSSNEVISSLIRGIVQTTDWFESHEPDSWRRSYERECFRARAVILAGLCCLPDPSTWFRFDDLEAALFRKVGHEFSINGRPSAPYRYRSGAEQKTEIEACRRETLNNWIKYDVPWLQAMFQSWLYAFGIVEISMKDGKVDCFRLTDAARAILLGEFPADQSGATAASSPAWIVQPNFDVVVYIGACRPTQLAFLQQYTERVSVSQHTGQYRITRNSVYAGLQQGGGVEELLKRLAAGSGAALPLNVLTEIRNWAGLTERITIRRRADLLEFADAEDRQSAIDRGVEGLFVADRFLLLREIDKVTRIADTFPRTVDYAKQPGLKSLNVVENGVIIAAEEHCDLITSAVLDMWAVRDGNNQWRLTRESVGAAAQDGRRTVQDLIDFLRVCAAGPMPALLEVAIRSWSGAPLRGGLGEVIVFRSSNPELLHALLASTEIQPYVVGRLGHDRVMLKKGPGLDKLREILEWAGVKVVSGE